MDVSEAELRSGGVGPAAPALGHSEVVSVTPVDKNNSAGPAYLPVAPPPHASASASPTTDDVPTDDVLHNGVNGPANPSDQPRVKKRNEVPSEAEHLDATSPDRLCSLPTRFKLELEQCFQCCCCHDLLYEPVTASCGHTFCLSCLNNWLQLLASKCPSHPPSLSGESPTSEESPSTVKRKPSKPTCPECRVFVSRRLPQVNVRLRDLLMKMYPMDMERRGMEAREGDTMHLREEHQHHRQQQRDTTLRRMRHRRRRSTSLPPQPARGAINVAADGYTASSRGRVDPVRLMCGPRLFWADAAPRERLFVTVVMLISLVWILVNSFRGLKLRTLLGLETFLVLLMCIKSPRSDHSLYFPATCVALMFVEWIGNYVAHTWFADDLAAQTVSSALVAWCAINLSRTFTESTHHQSGWRVAAFSSKRFIIVVFFLSMVVWWTALQHQLYFVAAFGVQIFLITCFVALRRGAKSDESYAIVCGFVCSILAEFVRRTVFSFFAPGGLAVGSVALVINAYLMVTTLFNSPPSPPSGVPVSRAPVR